MMYTRPRRRQGMKQPPSPSIRSQFAQLRHLPRALRLVWDAAAGWATASLVLLAIQGLLPIFTVYLTRDVVNALVAVVSSGGDRTTLYPAAVAILLMSLVLLTGEVLGSVGGYVQSALAERTQDHMNNLIQTKAISLDLRFYESPDYYDQLQRASIDALDRPLALLQNLSSLLQNSITLGAMGGVLVTFAWWMPLALLAGTAPALWVALRTTLAFHRWRLQNTMNQRRLGYYGRFLLNDQAAAEVRLFDLGQHFMSAYRRLRRQLRSERLLLSRQQMFAQIGAGVLGLLSVALALAWMAWHGTGQTLQPGRHSHVLPGHEPGPAPYAQPAHRHGRYLPQSALPGGSLRLPRLAAPDRRPAAAGDAFPRSA